MQNLTNDPRETSTFESFVTTEKNEQLVRALKQIAEQLASHPEKAAEAYPFSAARLIVLHGKPGRGKTHLVEAFIQALGKDWRKRTMYSNKSLTTLYSYEELTTSPRIIVLDDVYSRASHLSNISDFEFDYFLRAMMTVYEQRQLMILTTNFHLSELIARIRSKDTIGRVFSRVQEMSRNALSLELQGEDYREVLATQAPDDWFLPGTFNVKT